MSDYGWGMFKKGLKRRKKEVRRMRVMTCLAVFFLAFTLLLQDNIGALKMELNYRHSGRWFACASDSFFNNYSYLEKSGTITVGSSIYLLHPHVSADGSFVNDLAPIETTAENGTIQKEKPEIVDASGEFLPPEQEIVVENFGRSRFVEGHIGVLPEDFAENNGIRLYDGRFPQADDEIAMDLPTLHVLGLSYELGQEVSFYVSMKEPLLPANAHFVNGERVYDDEDLYLPLKLVSFTLVGTTERYTARWTCGSEMPSAIITQSAFDASGSYEKKLRFYDLPESIKGEDVWEYASSQFEVFSEREKEWLSDPRHLNENGEPTQIHKWNLDAYENPLWGSRTLYKYITILLAVMSACILAYLMASYLGKRRRFFSGMREIGSSSAEVLALAAYECVVGSLPFAAVSAAVAYGASAVIALILKNTLGTKSFFVFSIKTACTMLISVALVFAASLGAALLLFSGRGITQKKKRLGKGAEKALSRRAAKKQGMPYLGLSETLVRDRRIHSVKTFLLRAVTALVCGLILYSFAVTADSGYWYARRKNGGGDFYGAYKQNQSNQSFVCTVDIEPKWLPGGRKFDTEEAYLSTDTFWNTENTLGMDFIDDVAQLSGIKSFTYATYDNTHTLEWDGKDGDPFLDHCIDEALNSGELKNRIKLRFDGKHLDEMRRCMDSTLYKLLCFKDTKTLWRSLKPYLDKKTANYNDFVSGRQVVIVVDTELWTIRKNNFEWRGSTLESVAETEENKWEALGHSFDPGDTVTIKSSNGKDGTDTEVVIAGVIPASEYSKLAYGRGDMNESRIYRVDEDRYGLFMTVGSAGLAERVMTNDGGKFGLNVFGIKFDSIAASENVTKSLSALCIRYGVTFYDLTDANNEIHSEFIDTLLTYGFFGLLLVVLYLFVMGSVAKEDRAALVPKTSALYHAGTSRSALKLQKSLDAAGQSAWVLASVPVFILLEGAAGMKYHAPADNRLTTALLAFARSCIDSIKNLVGTVWSVISLLLLLLAVMLWLLNRKLVLEDELPERRN